MKIIRAAERDTITEDTQNNNTRRAPDNDPSLEEEEEEEEEEQTKEPGQLEKMYRHMKTQQQSLQTFCYNWNFDCKYIVVGSLIMTMIWGAGMIIVMIMQ